MQLKTVLKHYTSEGVKLGGEGKALDRESLQQSLSAVSRQNRIFFWLAAGMLLAVFAVMISLLLVYRDEPRQIALISGASGITILGTIATMMQLWKEKVASDFMLTLAGALDERAIRAVMETLMSHLYQAKSPTA